MFVKVSLWNAFQCSFCLLSQEEILDTSQHKCGYSRFDSRRYCPKGAKQPVSFSPPQKALVHDTILCALHKELVLRQLSIVTLQIETASAAAASTTTASSQEGAHGPALACMTNCVTEHLVNLLLRRHPPVGVGRTVHPDKL